MALLNCPECKKEISSHAKNCPYCGFPLQDEDAEYLACPKCLSKKLHPEKAGFSGRKAFAGVVLTGGIGILAGTIGSKNINLTCMNCYHRFKVQKAYKLKAGKLADDLDKKVINEYNKQKSLSAAIKIYHDATNVPLLKSKEYVEDLLKKNDVEIAKPQISSLGFIIILVVSLFALFILLTNNFSCKNNQGEISNNTYDELKTISKDNDSTQISHNLTVGKIYKIEGSQIVLRTGPGGDFDKLINKKVSSPSNETQYAHVDDSTKIKLLDLKNNWAKVQVVKPEWLKDTYIGWVPIEHVVEKHLDELLFEKINKDFLIFLLDSIKNKRLIEKKLNELYFFEDANGIYEFKEKIGEKGIHVIDIIGVANLIIFHTINKDLFNQICDELSENENQQDFTEGTDVGKKYQFDNYVFESLEPQNGVAPSRNVYYDIYIYRK